MQLQRLLRPEWPVLISGTVQHRSEGQTNEALATGEVELLYFKGGVPPHHSSTIPD